MLRKIGGLSIAIAALALSAPSMASAAQMTESGGGAFPTGTIFEAASSNTSIVTEIAGTVNCSFVRFSEQLTANGGGEVRSFSQGFGFGLNCFDQNNEGWDLAEFELLSMKLFGSGSGSGTLEGELNFGVFVECNLSGTVAISYAAGSNSIHIEGPVSAGPCGEMLVEGDFALTTTGGSIVLD